MILLDFSNIIIGSIMVSAKIPNEQRFSEDFIRHLVLNSIRSYRKKYSGKYGEMVICTDCDSSWRKVAFPYYKAHRKIQRAKQSAKEGVDWSALFDTINKIIEELQTFFPYKVIRIPHAEGDDVIGVLAKHIKEPCLVVSSDKDFNQLYKYKTVRQFSPMKQKMIKGIDADAYLKEHIIRGDKGDGIPNILSAGDCIVSGVRQKPISKKKVLNWLQQKPEDFCNNGMLDGWNRNQEVIDFDYIPPTIVLAILDSYNKQVPAKRSGLLNYFIKHKLKLLIDNIGDF
jgi:5'-3' exonuclease